MHQIKRNAIESEQKKVQENQGFAWQTNEMKQQSQQQSPSFQSSFHRLSVQEDNNIKKKQDEQDKVGNENSKRIEGDQEKEVKVDGGQQGKKLNKSSLQTLNNSIDKLQGCYTTEDGQDMTKYIIFKDFQSDSKANSKHGSKRESKQETPKYTPRFNFYTPDMLHMSQDAPFFEKSRKNTSNYQSQESFCFKEERNIGGFNPNSQNEFQHLGNHNTFQNFYSTLPQESAQANNQMGYEGSDGNNYYPYMIYQKNGNKQFEKQQQLNSYHLPQQKKKKIIMNNVYNMQNNANISHVKNTTNYHHQMNGDIQINNNKQMSMMIMMSQVQTHQKQHRLNKMQAGQINEKQAQYNMNPNGRVCQTEPAQDELGEESTEFISRYKDALAHQENGNNNHIWSEYEEQMMITGNHRKQQLNTSDNQSYASNSHNTSDFRNASQSKKPPIEINSNKQLITGIDQEDQDNNSSYNEEESYDVDQLRQNLMSDQLKFVQQNTGQMNNTKHNNFINQKLYQNQMSKIRQQVMLQQQNNGKNNQKSNGVESTQFEHQNRIIKRINTNPTGIGASQQPPVRIGSGDARSNNKANQMSAAQRNFLQINGDSNKFSINNGKSGVNWNEAANFNHSQRKFRQMSAHANSNNQQSQPDKINHLIDEDYNNESFMNLNNIPQDFNGMIPDGNQNQFMKQSPYQNNFIKLTQQNTNKQEPYNQNFIQQSSSIKRQLNFKNYQDENALMANNLNQEKQILKKKIQEFEKRKNLNLNSHQQQSQQQQQQQSSSSHSSGNNSKIQQNQSQGQGTATQSSNATVTVTATAFSAAQQAKKHSSLSRKKRSKTRSPAHKGLESIVEVSQRFENNLMAQSNLNDIQLKIKFSNSDQKKQNQQLNNSANNINANNIMNQNNLNSTENSSNEYDQYNFGKGICKTEGNDSSSSFQVNIDENESSRNVKTEQDYLQLSTSASSTNKISNTIQNQENTLSQTKSANSKLFPKSGKRIQSANYNQSSMNIQNNNLLHPQIALAINNQQNPLMNNLAGPSPQQLLQVQNNVQRGRFNSYQTSSGNQNQNQLSIQQLTKKLNMQSQSTTNNAQQNSLANTLLKNQVKKRSYTPLSATNNSANNQLLIQNNQFKDTFFLNPNEQSLLTGSRNNIKKLSRNQKAYSGHIQPEKDQLNLTASGAFVQQLSPISYQQLQVNNQQQQVFPNLQKQLAKRNEVASAGSALNNNINNQQQQQQQSSQQQQQQQQLIIQQRPSSRQVGQNQQQQLNINQQWQAQKIKSNINNSSNSNPILNQTLTSKLNKI